MKNPRLLASFAATTLLAAMCSVEAETAEASAASTETLTANDVGSTSAAELAGGATAEALAAATASAAAETRKRAAAANFLPIVRGRLPLVFVHAVRFDPVINAMGNKDAASKFATSVGKIFDIKKGRNFAYVDKDYKPSAEDLAAAQAWIDQVGAENAKGLSALGDKTLMTKVLDQYKAGGLATAEDIAKMAALRGATRTVKAATPAAAAGTLPATSTAKAETTQAAAAGAADDLLS